jgi:hypothetical protein
MTQADDPRSIPPSPPGIATEYAFTVHASLSPTIVVGHGPEGLRRYVPITGGTVDGPHVKGIVLPAGGDTQVMRIDEVLAVEAKYVIRTHDGVHIAVVNRGLRHGPREVIARLTQGQSVAPTEYYFRTVAQFEAPLDSDYVWLTRSLFMGTAERQADAAIVHFHRVL